MKLIDVTWYRDIIKIFDSQQFTRIDLTNDEITSWSTENNFLFSKLKIYIFTPHIINFGIRQLWSLRFTFFHSDQIINCFLLYHMTNKMNEKYSIEIIIVPLFNFQMIHKLTNTIHSFKLSNDSKQLAFQNNPARCCSWPHHCASAFFQSQGKCTNTSFIHLIK